MPLKEVPPHLRGFTFQTAGISPPEGIHFGFDSLGKIGDIARRAGATRALLVTDENMVGLGYAGRVEEALGKEGIALATFAAVEPEPHMETADALQGAVHMHRPDLIIGLGGGSSLDMAKLTALVATNDLSPEEFMSKKKSATRPALRNILVPTTSGTGSEVSRFIVVSKGKDKFGSSSPYAYADMVIIDPGLTISMPPRITAISGIDALAHAVDALMSKYCNPFFDSLACGAVELIARHLRRAFRDGQDLESRYSMSLAAMMAMMAVDGKGVALYSHSIAYILAAFKPVPHGIGCGVALPYTMGLNLPLIEDRLANVARIMGERAAAVSQRTAAERAVEAVYKLISDVGLPLGLKEMGYRQDDLPQMAEICLQKYRREYNPKALTAEDSLALFQAMWEGKIRYWEA